MKRKWNFLSNSFEVSTRRNHKKMLAMITHHTDMLRGSSDPFFQAMAKRTVPVMKDFQEAYCKWDLERVIRKGGTTGFRKMLKELYTQRLPRWEGHVLIRFPENTREYKALFGSGRTGFRVGTYYDRMEKVGAFARNLEAFPGLLALQLEVQEFYTNLHEGLGSSIGKSSQVKNSALQLEAARKAAAVRMYANLGLLMDRYCDDPARAGKYFEVGRMRALRRKKAKLSPVKQHAA